jgi:hypothetical protein
LTATWRAARSCRWLAADGNAEVTGKGLSSGEQPAMPAVNGTLSRSSFGAILSRYGIYSQQAKNDFSAMVR